MGLPLAGRTLLVVEDESIVFLLIEDMLKTLGCTDIRHASRIGEALALLDRLRPDAVILDVNLAGEPAYPVAERLDAAQIPFLLATGYDREGMPQIWAARPFLQKPFTLQALGAGLSALLGKASSGEAHAP